ncbi:MAG: hypothetical protein PVJ02_00650 [Gemmatimonadota bacterium]
MRTLLLLGLAASTVLTAGCSLLRRGDSGDAFARSQAGRQVLEIVVINLNFNDATLWVVSRAGKRTRLGMVTGKDEGHFTIPWAFSEPMAIEIDMVAGPRCTSDTLTADPGDIIELRIDVAFSESSACRPFGR